MLSWEETKVTFRHDASFCLGPFLTFFFNMYIQFPQRAGETGVEFWCAERHAVFSLPTGELSQIKQISQPPSAALWLCWNACWERGGEGGGREGERCWQFELTPAAANTARRRQVSRRSQEVHPENMKSFVDVAKREESCVCTFPLVLTITFVFSVVQKQQLGETKSKQVSSLAKKKKVKACYCKNI